MGCVSEFFETIEKELKSENRFSNSKLDALVELLIAENSNIQEFERGTIFKRARIYREPDAFERYTTPPDTQFQGYNERDSFVNKKGSEGRCNPQHIPGLYVANSVECCIAEVNPSIDSIISVAKIKVKEKLRILYLSKDYALSGRSGSILEGVPDCEVFLYLQNLFSRPYESEGDYLITQYISEKVKNAGFDGLSFHSSKYAAKDIFGIKKYGYNFVIFNYDKCKAISSKLYRVEAIEYAITTQQ